MPVCQQSSLRTNTTFRPEDGCAHTGISIPVFGLVDAFAALDSARRLGGRRRILLDAQPF